MRPEPLGNQYSHWTIALANRWFLVSFLGVFFAHFWMAAQLPPAQDELYYWTWAQDLAGGYFDHPPMVAYLIALSTQIFGDSILAIRLPACFMGMGILFLMSLLPTSRPLLWMVLMSPIFLIGSLLMTPDIPFLFFWTAYLLWLYHVTQPLAQWHEDPISRVYHKTPIPYRSWLVGGILLGLGLLSKYSMLLAIPCCFVVLATKYRWNAWLGGFVFHGIIALIVAAPMVSHNFQTDFASFLFQWHHGMDNAGFSFRRLAEFIGVQSLLVGALPFLLLPIVLLRAPEFAAPPSLRSCFYGFLLILFFAYRSLRGPVEANWALMAYVPFWALASRVQSRTSFRGIYRLVTLVSFLPALLASLLFFAHWANPLHSIPPEKDRLAKLETKQQLFKDIAEYVQSAHTNETIFTDTYQWISYLRYNRLNAVALRGKGRPNQFTQSAPDPCQQKELLVFSDKQYSFTCFNSHEVVREFPHRVRDKTLTRFALHRYTK